MIIIYHFFVQPQNAVVQRAVSLTANLVADEKKTVSLSRALKLLPGQKSAEERESLASRLLLGKIGAVSYRFDQEWISVCGWSKYTMDGCGSSTTQSIP